MGNRSAKSEEESQVDELVGKRLFQLRKTRGWTQKEMAEKVGIRFQQVGKYECGANRVSAYRLIQFARAFDVKIEDLLSLAMPIEKKTMNDYIRA